MIFERVLFATLGAIRQLMGGKVMPKGSKKGSKRDHFDANSRWFHLSKIIIFEVLEVPGDDLETISGMKAAQRALERCLRVQVCRF